MYDFCFYSVTPSLKGWQLLICCRCSWLYCCPCLDYAVRYLLWEFQGDMSRWISIWEGGAYVNKNLRAEEYPDSGFEFQTLSYWDCRGLKNVRGICSIYRNIYRYIFIHIMHTYIHTYIHTHTHTHTHTHLTCVHTYTQRQVVNILCIEFVVMSNF